MFNILLINTKFNFENRFILHLLLIKSDLIGDL